MASSFEPEERRIREFIEAPGGISESAASLADKLGISRRRCRMILERLVEQGVVRRKEFVGIDPLYVRFPSRG
jgi:DNA-binding Lrp family transcriptional regulator